jgi:glycosyltransferase involved in cell wall biosynthesis
LFVCIGTIEPRKNHLLLLNLWRRLASVGPAPHLVLIGRRGWENENIIDMLERCTVLQGVVEERSVMADDEVRTLLLGARALLLPSFAEGYGLPLAEALALGVPAICSDIPALREVGAEVPEFLDPLDGPAWRQAIVDYAHPDSPRRAAQLARLASWPAPTWPAHMATSMALLASVAETKI